MTPTHKRRARLATALQFGGDNPQEIIDKLHTIEGMEAHTYNGNERMILVHNRGATPHMQMIYTIYVGDWLCTGENGVTKRYTHEQFKIKYEEV